MGKPKTTSAKRDKGLKGAVSTIELIVTQHALDRLNDMTRFEVPPNLPIDEEVRIFRYRRRSNGEDVWMCQIEGGFLVGDLKHTRRRQMLVARTAISRPMFHKAWFTRLACHRLLIDKLTIQRGRT